MVSYILRRILSTLPVMAIVALFVFSLLYIAPGDPAVVIAGDQASPADVERIRQSLGLDRPFLVQFGTWVWHILHGDLGTSIFTSLPVSALIAQRIEPTLSLMVITLILTILIAVPLGVVAAWKAGSWVDRTIMGFAVFGFSVPVFVVGYVLAYVFALELEWLPVQGYTPLAQGFWPWLQNLILPSVALGCVYIALIARITRASMLEVLQQDYIRTARAKGLGQRSILFIHALKNAAVPIVTVIGIGIALLIGGAVVTESVFAIPGLGRLTVDAILRRDYPVIQGIVLMFSFLYTLVNLMVTSPTPWSTRGSAIDRLDHQHGAGAAGSCRRTASAGSAAPGGNPARCPRLPAQPSDRRDRRRIAALPRVGRDLRALSWDRRPDRTRARQAHAGALRGLLVRLRHARARHLFTRALRGTGLAHRRPFGGGTGLARRSRHRPRLGFCAVGGQHPDAVHGRADVATADPV